MSPRKLLIGASIAGHAALVTGVFIANGWSLERLDHDSRSRAALAVITPPPADSGSFSLPKQELQHKVPKVVVNEPRQPRKIKEDLVVTIDRGETSTGTGVGPGTGPGDGPAASPPCTDPGGCGTVTPPLPPLELMKPPPPPPPVVHAVTPQMLKGLRIRGVTSIHPPSEVFEQMHRGGDLRTSASIRLCLSASGAISSIQLKQSTRYPAYDEAILAAVHDWAYRPYTVNGAPVPACGMVTFVYEMK